ncbi:MAG: hypothetical protein M1830_003505 [Pleopsidium flavum]|nr:MAG: hypothetical protein M1830_003505 [Pleopsidium flavum]
MRRPTIATIFLFAASACSQIISDLPQCWQNCIHNSGDFNCADLDIPCICRISNGNFLTDVVTCVKGNCDDQLDSNLLITPLQLACNLAGTPISSAAIRNAENAQSSDGEGYTAQRTTVVVAQTTTTTADGGSQGVVTETVTAAPSTRATTITETTTDSQGSTYYVVVPITMQHSTTVYSRPSTVTVTSMGTVTAVPLGGASSSASMASQSAESVASSLSSQAAAENAGSTLSSQSTSTTTVTSASTTVTTTTSANNGAGSTAAASTNGSPFSMQSVSTRKESSSWLGLTVGLIAGVVWF